MSVDQLDMLFENAENTSYEKILNELLTENAIELKSDIKNPLALSQLASLADWARNEHCPMTEKVIVEFIARYLRYMVSYDRKSRTEIVNAFNQIYQNNIGMRDRLLGRDEQL